VPTARVPGDETSDDHDRSARTTNEIASKLTIAIVESDLSVRRALSRFLRSFELGVETYASGHAFLEAAHPDGVACLIVDFMLDDMTALELHERISRAGSAPPLIVLDACDVLCLEDLAMRSGAFAFFRMPFEPLALMSAVGKAITADAQDGASLLVA
jgi:two-component system, LuxR family, response regulator FixJ